MNIQFARGALAVFGFAASLAACGADEGLRTDGGVSDSARVDAAGNDAAGADATGRDVVRADIVSRTDVAVGDGAMCTASETPERTCNALDDDCNGFVDDVDVGSDGICDCLRIGVMGDPGSNASSSFQAWLTSRGTTVTRFGLDAAPLTAAQLAAFDVVILDQLRRDYTEPESAILRDFVAAGGGVMSMTGYTNAGPDRTRPNTLLVRLGLEYVPELRSGPVTMFAMHPLTAGLTSVTFLGGYRVAEVSGVSGGANTIVGSLSDGSVAVAQERGAGRVFVWGDEWVEFDSEWGTMPEITRFWVNALSWLGPRDRCRGPA